MDFLWGLTQVGDFIPGIHYIPGLSYSSGASEDNFHQGVEPCGDSEDNSPQNLPRCSGLAISTDHSDDFTISETPSKQKESEKAHDQPELHEYDDLNQVSMSNNSRLIGDPVTNSSSALRASSVSTAVRSPPTCRKNELQAMLSRRRVRTESGISSIVETATSKRETEHLHRTNDMFEVRVGAMSLACARPGRTSDFGDSELKQKLHAIRKKLDLAIPEKSTAVLVHSSPSPCSTDALDMTSSSGGDASPWEDDSAFVRCYSPASPTWETTDDVAMILEKQGTEPSGEFTSEMINADLEPLDEQMVEAVIQAGMGRDEQIVEAVIQAGMGRELQAVVQTGKADELEERVKTRAYYLWLNGSPDERLNYFQALVTELQLHSFV